MRMTAKAINHTSAALPRGSRCLGSGSIVVTMACQGRIPPPGITGRFIRGSGCRVFFTETWLSRKGFQPSLRYIRCNSVSREKANSGRPEGAKRTGLAGAMVFRTDGCASERDSRNEAGMFRDLKGHSREKLRCAPRDGLSCPARCCRPAATACTRGLHRARGAGFPRAYAEVPGLDHQRCCIDLRR